MRAATTTWTTTRAKAGLTMGLAGVLLAAAMCAGGLAHAESPPGLIPVQGVLTDDDGAVVNGSVAMVFSLYPSGFAETPLWMEFRLDDDASR